MTTDTTATHTLETAGASIVYDVRGPLPTADGRPPLFMIGQPEAFARKLRDVLDDDN